MTWGKIKSLYGRTIRFLGSLKIAVITILALAVISAIGTIVESRYNTEVAQKWVYFSVYMRIIMVMLVVSLTSSALVRWPWKKRHIGFLVVHLGIIILILGSYVTQVRGIDGTMYFRIGETSSAVSLNNHDFVIYFSTDGESYLPLFHREVDFLLRGPEKEKIDFPVGDKKIRVTEFLPFATEKVEVRASERPQDGPAVRFQLESSRLQVTEWIHMPGKIPQTFALGPAQVILAREKPEPSGENEILLWPSSGRELNYQIHTKSQPKKIKSGKVKIGEALATGWMDIQFRALTFYPQARQISEFQRLERPNQISRSAIKVEYGDEVHWIGLNSMLRLFDQNSVYIVTYGNRRIPLDFKITLDRFNMGTYQGTNRAMSYESEVNVEGLGKHTISMNEPLKHKGFTFYQASFEQDQSGAPSASVLSVNHDPGRWIKYLGSLLLVLGTLIMFYTRRAEARQEAK